MYRLVFGFKKQPSRRKEVIGTLESIEALCYELLSSWKGEYDNRFMRIYGKYGEIDFPSNFTIFSSDIKKEAYRELREEVE